MLREGRSMSERRSRQGVDQSGFGVGSGEEVEVGAGNSRRLPREQRLPRSVA